MFPDPIFTIQIPITQNSVRQFFRSQSHKSINISSKTQKSISAIRLCDLSLCHFTSKPQKVTSPGPIPHSKIRLLILSFYDVLWSQISPCGCFCLVKVPEDSKIRDWPSIFIKFHQFRILIQLVLLCSFNVWKVHHQKSPRIGPISF